jgi:hypothetical protein
MGDVDHNHPYQLIGKRTGSTFRVPGDYFASKPKLAVQDPTTGGPLLVVHRGTDDPVAGASLDDGGRIQFASEGR